MRRFVFALVVVGLAATAAYAQDPVKVDAKHYKVVFENEKVRVVDVKYGPKEKSVMHDHPALTAVFLTDSRVKFTYPDGKTEEMQTKAGESRQMPAVKHNPENLSDQPMEVILVEWKAKPAAAAATAPAKKAPAKK